MKPTLFILENQRIEDISWHEDWEKESIVEATENLQENVIERSIGDLDSPSHADIEEEINVIDPSRRVEFSQNIQPLGAEEANVDASVDENIGNNNDMDERSREEIIQHKKDEKPLQKQKKKKTSENSEAAVKEGVKHKKKDSLRIDNDEKLLLDEEKDSKSGEKSDKKTKKSKKKHKTSDKLEENSNDIDTNIQEEEVT